MLHDTIYMRVNNRIGPNRPKVVLLGNGCINRINTVTGLQVTKTLEFHSLNEVILCMDI